LEIGRVEARDGYLPGKVLEVVLRGRVSCDPFDLMICHRAEVGLTCVHCRVKSLSWDWWRRSDPGCLPCPTVQGQWSFRVGWRRETCYFGWQYFAKVALPWRGVGRALRAKPQVTLSVDPLVPRPKVRQSCRVMRCCGFFLIWVVDRDEWQNYRQVIEPMMVSWCRAGDYYAGAGVGFVACFRAASLRRTFHAGDVEFVRRREPC